jgi:hypothetical protein
MAQDDEEPARHWRANLAEAVLNTADRLAAEFGDLDARSPKAAEEIVAGFLRLRKRNLSASRSQLQFQLQAAQDGEQTEVMDLKKEVLRLTQAWDRLDRALARRRMGSDVGLAWRQR